MHRTCGTVAIKDGLLFVADFSGLFHCLDAKTGMPYWTHDMLAAAWGSPLIVDGKVYVGDEDGDICGLRSLEGNGPDRREPHVQFGLQHAGRGQQHAVHRRQGSRVRDRQRREIGVSSVRRSGDSMKRVLDVGQCAADHYSLRRLIEGSFDAEVVQARRCPRGARGTSRRRFRPGAGQSPARCRRQRRAGDHPRHQGRRKPGATPVMLVTNYPEHQEQAVAAGAVPGFGKAALHQPETRERLARILA